MADAARDVMLVLPAEHELRHSTRVAQLVAAATFVDAWAYTGRGHRVRKPRRADEGALPEASCRPPRAMWMLVLPKAHELRHFTRVVRARDVDGLVAHDTKSGTSRTRCRTEAAPCDDQCCT